MVRISMPTVAFSKSSMLCLIVLLFLCCVEVNSKTNYSLVTSSASYSDSCMTTNSIKCEYCCLTDSNACTNDRTICTPIYDRKLQEFFYAVCVLAGATILIPMLCYMLYFSLVFRFCGGYFKTGRGVTFCELLCRCMCICCINFDKKRIGGVICNRCKKAKSGPDYSVV